MSAAAPRIFVNIASYRDPECQWTVKDLFDRALHPELVTVGICWQFDHELDKHCFEIVTRPDQVRIFPVDWRESEGVCWARRQSQLLWDGEEYALQIDSHMRFVPGWDAQMINELAACDAEKSVLSCSPASYTPPNNLQQPVWPTVRRVKPFTPDGNIRGQGEALERIPEQPLNGAFIAGGFVFARSNIIEEVPYDPYLYFDQEEICYAMRLYTHGWDIFSSRTQFLYHYYNTGEQSARPLHWQDLRQNDRRKVDFLRDRGLRRFNHLSGYRASDDLAVTSELKTYGLGIARTLQQYEEYCGIDFTRKIASEKALRGWFIKDLKKYRSTPIQPPELNSQPPAVPVPAMLEAGDFVPLFIAENTEGKRQSIELNGGRHSLLFFLPAYNIEFLLAFFREMQQHPTDARQLFILDATMEQLLALKKIHAIPHLLSADPERRIARAFGLMPGMAAGYLLDPDLRIVRRHTGPGAIQLARDIAEETRVIVVEYQREHARPKIITSTAPALMVPNVLTPEQCRKCIETFKGGYTFEGSVGSGIAYQPQNKVRTDHIVGGELLAELDDKLSRSFFPEVQKIFGFEVTHRETYKIGMYSGEKGGFFRQHRDNFESNLGYRRVAATVHLNDDYEGGGLVFPEYGRDIYRPPAGGAIAFSGATLHEALPVAKGERYVLVCFLHSAEDEAFRQHTLAENGKPDPYHFTPTLRQYPDLTLSRDFYKQWRKRHVRVD